MKRVLIECLFRLVYERNGKQREPNNSDIILHLNDFWYLKLMQEKAFDVRFRSIALSNTNENEIQIMNTKIIIIENKGNVHSKETDDFFEIIYKSINV